MNRFLLITIGILSIIAGIFALVNPYAATVTSELITGGSFLVLGFLQIIAVFSSKNESTSSRIWAIILAIISIFLAINLLTHPLQGVIALTLIAGGVFLTSGIFKLILGFKMAGSEFRFAVFLSAIISILLSAMILLKFPESAQITLGILLAVELINSGITSIVLGTMIKKERTSS